MAPSQPTNPAEGSQPGPHPSYIQIAKPYIFETRIQECMLAAGINEARDEDIRLQAVAWIDNDAAAAALFTACKIEDTLKKSRDILCAAHNEKLAASEQVTPDDPIFENHAKTIIGIERLMLEASGFDFRNRYPQRLVLKLAKVYGADKATFGKTAYNMSLDLYRTFAPLKQTTPTMAIACVELAGRVLGKPVSELESGKDYKQWRIARQEVMETLLDLLDLYTHHRSSTIVGQDHALEEFISIRIALNQEASAEKLPRFAQSNSERTKTNGTTTNGLKDKKDQKGLISPRSISSPKEIKSPQPIGLTSVTGTPVQGKPGLKEGTVRFMLDPERARDEKHTVAEFFKMDEEEYEVEVKNDRRRDSAIGVSPEVAGRAPARLRIHVDTDQRQNDTIKHSRNKRQVGQENHPNQKDQMLPTKADGGCCKPPDPARTSKVSLPDQGLAFKAALQGLDVPSTGTRSGEHGKQAHTNQENYPATTGKGFKPGTQSTPKKRMPKIPLAEQGVAFQAALEQSNIVPPNIRGGAFGYGEQDDEIRIKGAAAAATQHRAAAQVRKWEKNAKRKQQRGWQ
ncbi:MAG: hypothetical protein Q9171_007014 [Xanthocarpia ochracea]